ncbi:hypothetical protein EDC04DRAFT_2644801 [Pisolithus marmoratus]|nr:hypothetical protein EDC04DRAFT_2644801 [Pisolithus marmoratus]
MLSMVCLILPHRWGTLDVLGACPVPFGCSTGGAASSTFLTPCELMYPLLGASSCLSPLPTSSGSIEAVSNTGKKDFVLEALWIRVGA